MKKHLYTIFLLVISMNFTCGNGLARDYDGKKNPATNKLIEKQLLDDAPYLFDLPKAQTLNIGQTNNGDIVFDYYNTESSKVGLKLYIVKKDISSRFELTKRLRQEDFLEDGDVILTYHPEWGNTGPYPSIMAGISHSGLVYIDGAGAKNIDMPLNEEQNLDLRGKAGGYVDKKPSYLSSDHYINSAGFVHILRPKRLNSGQKNNLNHWAKMFASRVRGVDSETIYGPDKNQTSFNGNYLSPAYAAIDDPSAPLGTHSLDLARLVIGKPLEHRYIDPNSEEHKFQKNLPLFCSDFVWSLQAIRDCDPTRFNGDNCTPKPLFSPLPFIGQFHGEPGDFSNYQPGLTDAPFLMLNSLDLRPDQLRPLIRQALHASKPMTNISSGHRKAAELIPEALYQSIEDYWVGYFSAKSMMSAKDEETRAKGRAMMRTVLEKGQAINLLNVTADKRPESFREYPYVPKNYSPTTFLINAMLPNSNRNKVFDYVGTVAFVDEATYDKITRALGR